MLAIGTRTKKVVVFLTGASGFIGRPVLKNVPLLAALLLLAHLEKR
jgi:hypothetical protein